MHPAVDSPSLGTSRCISPPEEAAHFRRPSPPRRSSTERTSRPLSHQHSDTPRSKPKPNMVTPEEYEALPPSIQKKYFSSVERLRIAQQAASQRRKKQNTKDQPWLSPKPSLDSVRPKTAHSFRPSPSLSQLSRFRKSSQSRSEADVDESQALWFLALPDKLKRINFTPEELTLLTESSERALGISITSEDSASRRTTLDRNGSIGSYHYQSSVSEEFEDFEKDWYGMDSESIMSSEPGAHELEILKLYARQRQGSESTTYSSIAPEVVEPRPESRRKSFTRKRAISLAPIPLPPPTLLPAVPPLPSPSTLRSMEHVRSPLPLPSPVDSATETKYYKDTSARSKLREYVASPEKFDEVLEFGFRPDRRKRATSMDEYGDELNEDLEELSIANSKDDEDMSSTMSPRTPAGSEANFGGHATPHSSLDSGKVLPPSNKVMVRSLSPELGGREMTLRMTLTKPELRAPEAELYSFQRREVSGVDLETRDPLALDALPVCEDHSGAQGAFAVQRNSKGGFKRAWKSFRGR
ncbi:hypothetical protein HII31_12413 [Pseudocercospora fuligena]|uniref:Uncharacterized protein n=1 Tax=Pseudocercospora fuligena TaxID=685502 RepID=A0A8H6R893_9PEZI|nr:hypothetical protein HII31_12413 [Pseudocercospora fuligena]